jgi:hypothetical protein
MMPAIHNMSTYHGQNFFEGAANNDMHSDDGDEDKFVNHSVPFPWELHEMLEAAENEVFTNAVSWLPDYQSFKVHQTETFVNDIMPKYFRQTKYKSFQRQCKFSGLR